MIILQGTIIIPKDAQAEALPLLEAHIEASRAETGNITFKVDQDETHPEIFHVYEEFEDEKSFANHQQLGRARPWGEASKDFVREFEKSEV